MPNYLKNIWSARYFFLYLAGAELKYKFRRSKLGLLWTMITPLVLTLIMSFMFGNLLHTDIKEYAPYIFSGLIIWEFVIGSVVGGCNSLIGAESYIKQYKHPFAIYPLKTTIINISTFLIALSALALWTLITKPVNFLYGLVSLPFTLVCLVCLGWPLAIITSFTNTKYRDFTQISTLVMQLLWYLSPVFFKPAMLSAANLSYLIDYNPVTHILNLIRAPMLNGQFPSLFDYVFVLGTAAVLAIVAVLRIRSSEKGLIYYF